MAGTEPNGLRPSDVLLMTEYADRASYDDREAIFGRIFASEAFASVRAAPPEGNVRSFFDGDVALRTVADGGPR